MIPKPAEVYIPEGPELRVALVEILALKLTDQSVPRHLSMNDRLNVTAGQNFRRAQAKLRESGSFDNARSIAEEFVPEIKPR